MKLSLHGETSLGKPLISDTALRGMHRAMQHLVAEKHDAGIVATLSRADQAALQDGPEAVLAALFSQLHRRDMVVTQGANPLAQTAVDAWFAHTGAPTLHPMQVSAEECAAVAAGMALRIHDRAAVLNRIERDRRVQPVVIALLRGSPPLVSVLQIIEQHELALVLVTDGEPESRAEAQRRQQSTSVPLMPVDRTDAVAVCRVVQECLLRARNGWGGALIHALRVPGAQDPLGLMRRHLQKRGLLHALNVDETAPG